MLEEHFVDLPIKVISECSLNTQHIQFLKTFFLAYVNVKGGVHFKNIKLQIM